VSCGGSLHLCQAALDDRGTAGLRGACTATSLKRSPMPTGSACAPVAQSGSRGRRANPRSWWNIRA